MTLPGLSEESGTGSTTGLGTYIGYSEHPASGNTQTYDPLSNNSPGAGRLYFCIAGETSGQKTAATLTVGGVSATKISNGSERSASFTTIAWFYFDHAGGALGTLVATFTGSGTMGSSCIQAILFTDYDSITHVGGGNDGDDGSFTSLSITTITAMLEGDWALSAYRADASSSRTVTWSNQTEAADTYLSTEACILGAAIKQQTANQPANTPIGITASGSVSSGSVSTLIVRPS